jgi:hypothetical protein
MGKVLKVLSLLICNNNNLKSSAGILHYKLNTEPKLAAEDRCVRDIYQVMDENENGTKRLVQVVVVMMFHQAELAHRVTGIAADMTYKHTSGDMKVYRWTSMDPAIGRSMSFSFGT